MTSDAEEGQSPARKRSLAMAVRRLVIIVLLTVVTFYVAACVAIFFVQDRLIYYPARDYGIVPSNVGLAYEDLTLTTNDGVDIAAWFVPHAEAKGTIIFSHGNAGNMAGRCQTLNAFHHLGYSVLIFDYRGYGRSSGAPSEEGIYRDAEAAWRYLVVPANVHKFFSERIERRLGRARNCRVSTDDPSKPCNSERIHEAKSPRRHRARTVPSPLQTDPQPRASPRAAGQQDRLAAF